MLQGYHQAAATLNLLRAFTKGGFADLNQVHMWNQEFVASSPEGRRYEALASEIERALRFMAACGIDLRDEPQLLRAVREAQHPVVWACDPMHANVFTSASGRKTRHFDAIMAEIEGFFAAHRQERTWPGGVHLEFTGEDVTGCPGGAEDGQGEHPPSRYMTPCDP